MTSSTVLLIKNYCAINPIGITAALRHGVKVGPGPRDPRIRDRDPPQSLKVGPGTPLKFKSEKKKKVRPQVPLQNLKVEPKDPLQSLKAGPS